MHQDQSDDTFATLTIRLPVDVLRRYIDRALADFGGDLDGAIAAGVDGPLACAPAPGDVHRPLTMIEAAARIGVSRRTVGSLIERGALVARQIGTRKVILPADLDAFLLASATTPPAAAPQ
jgi:excisionase family DNA binding protein